MREVSRNEQSTRVRDNLSVQYYSVLQCVAVRSSVWHCVAVHT